MRVRNAPSSSVNRVVNVIAAPLEAVRAQDAALAIHEPGFHLSGALTDALPPTAPKRHRWWAGDSLLPASKSTHHSRSAGYARGSAQNQEPAQQQADRKSTRLNSSH